MQVDIVLLALGVLIAASLVTTATITVSCVKASTWPPGSVVIVAALGIVLTAAHYLFRYVCTRSPGYCENLNFRTVYDIVDNIAQYREAAVALVFGMAVVIAGARSFAKRRKVRSPRMSNFRTDSGTAFGVAVRSMARYMLIAVDSFLTVVHLVVQILAAVWQEFWRVLRVSVRELVLVCSRLFQFYACVVIGLVLYERLLMTGSHLAQVWGSRGAWPAGALSLLATSFWMSLQLAVLWLAIGLVASREVSRRVGAVEHVDVGDSISSWLQTFGLDHKYTAELRRDFSQLFVASFMLVFLVAFALYGAWSVINAVSLIPVLPTHNVIGPHFIGFTALIASVGIAVALRRSSDGTADPGDNG